MLCLADLGLRVGCFHLRHAGAVLAAQSGATLADLMGRLGHTTPAMAMIYQHTAADRDRLIADRLSQIALGNQSPLGRECVKISG